MAAVTGRTTLYRSRPTRFGRSRREVRRTAELGWRLGRRQLPNDWANPADAVAADLLADAAGRRRRWR